MRIIALLVALSFSLMAQAPPTPSRRPGFGGPVSPPSVVHKVEPEYSEEARRASLEGTVLLRIIVDEDGRPRELKVMRSLGLGLDEKAIVAVSNWQFAPGTKEGQPVPVQAQIEVNFRLLDHDSKLARWHLARAEFHIPDGAMRPVVEKSAALVVDSGANNATATLSFDIDEKGAPVNVRLDQSSDEGWSHDVAETLKKWSFTPASKDGSPVSVPCTMDFVRGN
jgi:TonB family protein